MTIVHNCIFVFSLKLQAQEMVSFKVTMLYAFFVLLAVDEACKFISFFQLSHTMMVSVITSLSSLFQSYRDAGMVNLKGSVQ